MKAASFKEKSIYSGGYVVGVGAGQVFGYRRRSGRRLAGFLRSMSGRIWQAICFKVILLTLFACTSGFFIGATWAILELGDLEEEGGETVELILNEAKI